MDILQEKIINSIEIVLEERLKDLKFNQTLECKILEVLTSPKYKIICNGDEYTVKAINGQTYAVNDLVYVLALNNDTSNKIILCKIP